jgi:hypothetical protein
MNINNAIFALYQNVVHIKDDGFAYDADDNVVQYDKAAVEAYVAANEYKTKRIAEYPPVTDQLDTIFHEGLDVWKAQIQAVKNKYPKD